MVKFLDFMFWVALIPALYFTFKEKWTAAICFELFVLIICVVWIQLQLSDLPTGLVHQLRDLAEHMNFNSETLVKLLKIQQKQREDLENERLKKSMCECGHNELDHQSHFLNGEYTPLIYPCSHRNCDCTDFRDREDLDLRCECTHYLADHDRSPDSAACRCCDCTQWMLWDLKRKTVEQLIKSMCVCGHGELDHNVVRDVKAYSLGCGDCDCPDFRDKDIPLCECTHHSQDHMPACGYCDCTHYKFKDPPLVTSAIEDVIESES